MRAHRLLILAGLGVVGAPLGGCGGGCANGGGDGWRPELPPEPLPEDVIFDDSPGYWGDLVHISGTHLTRDPSWHLYVGEFEVFADQTGQWTDESLIWRMPFPYRGAVELEAFGQRFYAGEFELADGWTAGEAVTTGPVLALEAGDTRLCGVVDRGDELWIHTWADDGEILSLPLNNAGVEGDIKLAERGDRCHLALRESGGSLYFATMNAGGLADAATGVEVSAVIGFDGEEDPALWTVEAGALVERRPSNAFAAEGEPYVFGGDSWTRGSVTSDGRVVVAWGDDAGGALNQKEMLRVGWFDPELQTFDIEDPDGAERDDYVVEIELQVSPDGERALVSYCASNDQLFTPSELTCYTPLARGAGAWVDSASNPELMTTRMADTGLVHAIDGDSGVLIDFAGQDPRTLPLWGGVTLALAVDPSGEVHLLEQGADGRLYRPRR